MARLLSKYNHNLQQGSWFLDYLRKNIKEDDL